MDKGLDRLIEQARKHVMSAEERQEQLCSFAYGNTHFENESITKEHIREAVKLLRLNLHILRPVV